MTHRIGLGSEGTLGVTSEWGCLPSWLGWSTTTNMDSEHLHRTGPHSPAPATPDEVPPAIVAQLSVAQCYVATYAILGTATTGMESGGLTSLRHVCPAWNECELLLGEEDPDGPGGSPSIEA